ncbi:MAG: molybdopterin-dependent oxidoreductase, partial [Deltaproteobacteria bacterium]
MGTSHSEAPKFSAGTRQKNLVKMRTPQGVEEFEVVKTNCFECHSKCGLFSYIKDGKLIKVEGNPEEPRSEGLLCSKGLAATQMLYSPDRIDYPMKRTNPKGADDPGWVRITWDEALDTIVNKILENREKYGPYSVVIGQGTGRGTNQWNQRLGVAIGHNHWLCPAHVCLLPIMLTSMLTTGFFAMWDSPDMINSKCFVSWGSNAAWTSLGYSGAGIRTILQKQAKGEAKLIQVDPRYEAPLSSKADVWLPIRPGSDAAMAMSWIHVIISEKLYQEDFVKSWTNGPFLVRDDNGALLTEADAMSGGAQDKFMVWDANTGKSVPADEEGIAPALFGGYTVNGIACKPAFQILADNA